ncbi:MAG TPA: hypothetical protein VJ650_12200 [Gemmatimonadaceae bacterium]|nr:hypothetical protein [Gemmatimonadaceae bacterium]
MPGAKALTCLLTLWASASACAPDVAESPHASLLQLARAVQTGDTATTLRYVDLDAIATRLLWDVWETVRDSLEIPPTDTLSPVLQARLDSIKGEWLEILRADLGLIGDRAATETAEDPPAATDDEDPPLNGDDGVLAEGAEVVGDGAVRFVGDTALVERFIRYAHLDTSVTLTITLVPIERLHWRVVGLRNAVSLGSALQRRRLAILQRANKRLRDTIDAHVAVRDLTIRREPLEEWDRYVAAVHVLVQNRSAAPLVVHSAHLVGPHLRIDDSVGQVLAKPLTLAPGGARPVLWRHPLRGEHVGPYDVVNRPSLYTIEVTDVELGGSEPRRVQLYNTWQEFVDRNPLPARSSGGVLAGDIGRATRPVAGLGLLTDLAVHRRPRA